ncbi:MAG: serine/threonine protein kinase [Thermoanaerobaculia bacterium]|jgi:serine/threonine protein kinase|nr:serine/threonine protein kinase [Thermoanaerobaculia bacterium]MBP9824158.1 serine/threonine protein kinase [Thermoanaerobaculia bacterium]
MSPLPPGSLDPALGSSVLPPGCRIGGHYRVLDRLGRPGGFGQTYRALDERLRREVAIKEYFPRELVSRAGEDPLVRPLGASESAQFEFGKLRFLEEGRTLARISHPRVVRVLELFEENRTAYLVMEYHRGANLAEVAALSGGRLDEEIVRTLLLEILDGLEAVHRQGVLHCDIKPSNLYLTGTGVPLLLDFGAARRDFGERTATLDGILSPGYAPFELFQERGRLGAWTDVYGVAATAVALLTGERPPSAADRIAADPLRAAGPLTLRLPPGLRAPLVAALAVRPEERTASAERFRAGLHAAEGATPAPVAQLASLAQESMARLDADAEVATGSSTTTISRPSARRRRARSRRWLVAALLSVVAGAAIWTAWYLRLAGANPPFPAPAAVPAPVARENASVGATAPLPSGEVLFEVVPFGELVELRDATGRELLGAAPIALPARLRLPTGDWTAVLRYPVSGELAALPLRVVAGEALRLEHRFARLEARAYFEATGW